MSLFHYVTYKYIIIKDKRLGVAYYSLALLILLYTIVQVVINKAYLKKLKNRAVLEWKMNVLHEYHISLNFDESPRGIIRLLVSTPPVKDATLPSYCDDVACQRVDGLTLNWPVESRSVTIATFIKEIIQEKDCGDKEKFDMNSHTLYSVVRQNHYFPFHPEEALIKVEHSISTISSFSASHRMMKGKLLGVDGSVIKILNSSNSSRVDKIFLKDFLLAANVSLDKLSNALSSQGRTYRQNGVVLKVTIDYRNVDNWFGVGDTEYTYSVQQIKYSDYRLKQELPIALPNGTICKRIVNKRYATRIEFEQAGKIGTYCLSTLLLQLVSLMGLLTLTATVIDVIALYLVPAKDTYRQYVYDFSPELSGKSKKE